MQELSVCASVMEIRGLKAEADDEFLLKRTDNSAQSDLRLVRTGCYPGAVVNYLHPQDPEGGGPQNLTLIFRSEDGGQNWRHMTEPVRYDPAWPGAVDGPCPGYIEGNAVVSPDGKVCDYLRIDHASANPAYGKAVILEMTDPDAPMKLHKIVNCPIGSNAKFQLRRDPETGVYLAIGSEVVNPATPKQRTVLSLCISRDFETWETVDRLVDRRDANPQKEGYQYVDWQFDGNDLIVVCSTAVKAAHNDHDSNCITFHRVADFRQWL